MLKVENVQFITNEVLKKRNNSHAIYFDACVKKWYTVDLIHLVKMSNPSPERTQDQRDGCNPSN